MRHLRHRASDAHIVVVVGGGLGVGLQRAVHHDAGEAVLDGAGAGGFVVAVVLVHADGDVRIDVDQGVNHTGQHDVVGVLPRAAAGLDDHRAVGGLCGLHDRQPLLHVVDVEGRDAIAVLGGVIEKLAKGDARQEALRRCAIGLMCTHSRRLLR